MKLYDSFFIFFENPDGTNLFSFVVYDYDFDKLGANQ